MDISVIIPACNAEAYVGEAIQSVLDQSFAAREILVVDDGSTDATARRAQSFGPGVHVLQQPNQGVSAARNRGIRAATGSWLAFLDADDVMTPDRLAIQRQMHLDQPELEILLGQQILFQDQLSRVPKDDPRARRPGLIASTMTCRADVFRRVGLFDVQLHGPEFIAWFAVARTRGISHAVSERPVVYRRMHAGSLSRRMRSTPEAYPLMIKKLLDQRRAA